MYNPSLNWREQVKHIVQEMHSAKSYVLSGVVTSVNNTLPYTVKVKLEPYEIETGWIPIASSYVGHNYGLILPPPAEGTHVRVLFDMGDINSGVIIGSTFNEVTPPPQINFGDAAIYHQSGSNLTLKADGSIVINAASGKTVTINGQSSQSW